MRGQHCLRKFVQSSTSRYLIASYIQPYFKNTWDVIYFLGNVSSNRQMMAKTGKPFHSSPIFNILNGPEESNDHGVLFPTLAKNSSTNVTLAKHQQSGSFLNYKSYNMSKNSIPEHLTIKHLLLAFQGVDSGTFRFDAKTQTYAIDDSVKFTTTATREILVNLLMGASSMRLLQMFVNAPYASSSLLLKVQMKGRFLHLRVSKTGFNPSSRKQ